MLKKNAEPGIQTEDLHREWLALLTARPPFYVSIYLSIYPFLFVNNINH